MPARRKSARRKERRAHTLALITALAILFTTLVLFVLDAVGAHDYEVPEGLYLLGGSAAAFLFRQGLINEDDD